MKRPIKIFLFLISFVVLQSLVYKGFAQRTYASQSVLTNGNWYKIAITNDGVYKIDVAFLNSNNISTTSLLSESIKIFGNHNAMISEDVAVKAIDDLVEIPLEMNDGGDGLFNSTDFLFFYAQSPHIWLKDSINKKFIHKKNIYTDTAFYFLQIGGTNGKRILPKPIVSSPNVFVNSYVERYFYEPDLINVLSSGKEWYGDEFSMIRGNNLSKTFNLNWQGLNLSQPLVVTSNLISRSIGATSVFNVLLNNQLIQTHNFNQTAGGYLDFFGFSSTLNSAQNVSQSSLNLTFNYNASSTSQGFMNWFEIFGIRNLSFQNQLTFRDWASVAAGNIAQFTIQNSLPNTQVWDITNVLLPQKLSVLNGMNQTVFNNEASTLKEYIAFDNSSFLIPFFLGKLSNQNLHQSSTIDGIIITHKSLLPQAQRLAQFHFTKSNYRDIVVTTEQVFNEFSAGKPDPGALRDFVKMFYDKAGIDSSKRPKYLLLFGAASFDYKNRIINNTNLVPCYESINSLDPLTTHTTDDFFGFLNDDDDINNTTIPSLLDIAIGRIPAKNIEEATMMVDKIVAYHSKESFGSWRNQSLFIADDKDINLHLQDAELISNTTSIYNSLLNIDKVYLDAYSLQSSSSGARYPDVNSAIVSKLFSGALICNYTGHGSYQRLSEEAVFTFDEIQKLNNSNKLPLFITATCDFAPYDDPSKNSLGSSLLFSNSSGAIALLTTTRVVFAFSNKIMNNNYLSIALKKNNDGKYYSLGEGMKLAKNITYTVFGDIVNNRKFTLLGDPAMQLGLPIGQVQLQKINNQNITGIDTLKPLEKYKFEGIVTNEMGNFLPTFNGSVFSTIYDKPQLLNTKGNTPQSPQTSYELQNNIVYKGKTNITDGKFSFEFIVPKDVSALAGKGKLSLYANDNNFDASGVSTNFNIGGQSKSNFIDNNGPLMRGYLNDEKFINGGLTNENPILLVKLFDSSGINSSGLGIGHDIILIIDGKEKEAIVLNTYYETLLNSYQKGELRFALPKMANGQHQLTIKAWDIANNSTTIVIDFVVQQQENLTIKQVLNYPNPFTTNTNFWFEHNQPNENIEVFVNIYTITGKLVKQIKTQVNTIGTRVDSIFWDGKDENSEKLAKGVYIYTIIANSKNGRAQSTQKLYLL